MVLIFFVIIIVFLFRLLALFTWADFDQFNEIIHISLALLFAFLMYLYFTITHLFYIIEYIVCASFVIDAFSFDICRIRLHPYHFRLFFWL